MTKERLISRKRTTTNVFPMMKNYLALIILTFCVGCTSEPTNPNNNPPVTVTPDSVTIHVNLGVPKDIDSTDDFLIKRTQYQLSYNPNLNVANWVSWNENATWYGNVPRCDCFAKDTALPQTFTSVTENDYTNSGYDRSHILGSEARTRSAADNKATFFMSNIFPQTPDLNRETWASMEKFQDSLSTKANKELFVIAGGLYITKQKIKGKVTIPDSCWKIVVVLDRNQRYAAVNSQTEIYAVMMNNGTYTTANNDWRLYRTTVRKIEQSTGYNFLSNISQTIQDAIENR